jgi:hypothetical protein
LRGGRVVQVIARVMAGRALSNCWHNVVLPPPDGAEIRIKSGAELFLAISWMGRMKKAE